MLAMNVKVDALMRAIVKHEGWNVPAINTPQSGSRSYRNHNPGNLRKSPFAATYVDNFAVFANDFIGYMALHWDLMQKAHGNTVTGLTAQSTIRELIFVYAPPDDDNDSEAYLQAVLKETGFLEQTTLGEIFDC